MSFWVESVSTADFLDFENPLYLTASIFNYSSGRDRVTSSTHEKQYQGQSRYWVCVHSIQWSSSLRNFLKPACSRASFAILTAADTSPRARCILAVHQRIWGSCRRSGFKTSCSWKDSFALSNSMLALSVRPNSF